MDTDPFNRKDENAPVDDPEPPDPKIEPCPIFGYAARLCRVFPAALAFAMSEDALPRYFVDAVRLNEACNPWDDQPVTSRWASWDTYRDMKYLAGDFNGNGKTDVMKFDVPSSGVSQLGLWVGLSNGRQSLIQPSLATSLWARFLQGYQRGQSPLCQSLAHVTPEDVAGRHASAGF